MPDVLDPKLDTVNDTPLAEDEELLEGVRGRSRVPGDFAADAFADADSGSAGLDFESAGLGNLNEDFSTLNRPNPQAGLSSLPKKLFPGELKKPRPKVPVARSLGSLRNSRGVGSLAGKFKGGKSSLANAVPGGGKLMGAADKLIETRVKRSAVGLAAGAFDKIAGTNVSKDVADITKAGVKGALEGGVAGAVKEIGQEVLTDPKKRKVIIFSAVGLVLFQAFAGIMVFSAVMIGLCSVPGFSTMTDAASGASSLFGGPSFAYCDSLNLTTLGVGAAGTSQENADTTLEDVPPEVLPESKVPYYSQHDPRWGNQKYGNQSYCTTISQAGCGPTAAAMVLRYYGIDVTPPMVAQIAADNGMRVCNVDPRKNRGTSRAFFRFLAQYYNLTSDDNLNWQETVQYLRQGRPVIVSGAGPQPFTRNGHFIVLVEYNDDGTITVNDPNKGATNGRPAVAKYPVGVIRDNFHFSTVFYR